MKVRRNVWVDVPEAVPKVRWPYHDGGMGAVLATPKGMKQLLREIKEAADLFREVMTPKRPA
jgi:hypothetical protein